jgi:hypothetical protein
LIRNLKNILEMDYKYHRILIIGLFYYFVFGNIPIVKKYKIMF